MRTFPTKGWFCQKHSTSNLTAFIIHFISDLYDIYYQELESSWITKTFYHFCHFVIYVRTNIRNVYHMFMFKFNITSGVLSLFRAWCKMHIVGIYIRIRSTMISTLQLYMQLYIKNPSVSYPLCGQSSGGYYKQYWSAKLIQKNWIRLFDIWFAV